jgi:hypothetical protein
MQYSSRSIITSQELSLSRVQSATVPSKYVSICTHEQHSQHSMPVLTTTSSDLDTVVLTD